MTGEGDTRVNLRPPSTVLELALFAVAVCVLNIYAYYAPNIFISILSLIIYVVFALWVFSRHPVLFFLSLPFFFFRLTEVMSFVAIENGAYMTESAKYGTATGGSARYLILTGLFVSAVALCLPSRVSEIGRSSWLSSGRLPVIQELFLKAFAGLVLLIHSYVILYGLLNGFPVLINAERFAFWSTISDPIVKIFLYYPAVLSLMIGAVCAHPDMRKAGGALFLLHFGLLFLFGMQQTSLSVTCIAFAVVPTTSLALTGHRFSVWKFGVLAIVVFAVSIAASVSAYATQFDAMVARLVERTALQGQLWHLADEMVMLGGPLAAPAQFAAEAGDWFGIRFRPSTEVGFEYGLYRVMLVFARPDILFYYTRDGIGFIFALFPAWLVSYGYLALFILTFFAGLVWGLLCRLVIATITTGHVTALVPLALVFTMQLSAHVDGMSYRIFGLQVWAFLAVAFLINLFLGQRGLSGHDASGRSDSPVPVRHGRG